MERYEWKTVLPPPVFIEDKKIVKRITAMIAEANEKRLEALCSKMFGDTLPETNYGGRQYIKDVFTSVVS